MAEERKQYNAFKIETEKFNFVFRDEHGKIINHRKIERPDQFYAYYYIIPTDIVLELGARYGSVSCTVNKKLRRKTNHVVVEPDKVVWPALQKNKDANNAYFHIVHGFISKKRHGLSQQGYGSSMIKPNSKSPPSFDLDELQKESGLRFNALIVDCEGCFELFLNEYPHFLKQLRVIIYERDGEHICDYSNVEEILRKNKFSMTAKTFDSHKFVWHKKTITRSSQ